MADIKDDLIDALNKALHQWRMYYENDGDENDIHQDENTEADLFRHCVSVLAKAKG